jgi:hypothetical protein
VVARCTRVGSCASVCRGGSARAVLTGRLRRTSWNILGGFLANPCGASVLPGRPGDFAGREAHPTTTHCEAGNLPRNACVGHTRRDRSRGVRVRHGSQRHGRCRDHPCNHELVDELTVSVSWNWHGFPGGRAGGGITGITGVGWTHQAAHRPPNRPQLMMSEIKTYPMTIRRSRGLATRFARNRFLHFARGPGSVMAALREIYDAHP